MFSRKKIAEMQKRLENIDDKLAKLAIKISDIENRLSECDDSVNEEINSMWDKALESVIDFNPFKVGGGIDRNRRP